MSAYGLAMLRTGQGSNAAGVALYYGPGGGHDHYDRLNLEFFAKGQRISPDIGYPDYADNFVKKRFGWVLFHSACYWAVMLIVSMPVMSEPIFLMGSISAAVHMAIDTAKYLFLKSIRKKSSADPHIDRNLFFGDQLLHIASIAILAYVASRNMSDPTIHDFYRNMIQTFRLSVKSLTTWAIALLAIHKPANIAITKLLAQYKPTHTQILSEGKQDGAALQSEITGDRIEKDKNAGRMIGTLERTVMLILIALGQYSAIGLVLTAKSIARYDRIVREAAFSEYYLLGTLMSTLAVIAVSFVL
jgi:hypothetical protein